MKSIRLSLIVYFLVLLTGALGAVSWFSYSMTAVSLRERQGESRTMIEAQCDLRSQAARDDLDRRILQKAQKLASMRLVTGYYEALFPLSAFGTAAMPQGFLHATVSTVNLPYQGPFVVGKEGMLDGFPYIPVWLAQGRFPDLNRHFVLWQYPRYTHIDQADVLVGLADPDHPQEYFQLNRWNGQPMQRSDTMGSRWFNLTPELQKELVLLTAHFDEVELQPGEKIRRVTLKVPVSRLAGVTTPWPYRGPLPTNPSGSPGKNLGSGPTAKGPNPKTAKPELRGPASFDAITPIVFIQYASDLDPIEEKITQFQTERDDQLAQLESTVEANLGKLRGRMLWIGLAALGALWLGGYLVIRLGLSPLAKMSEAVSQVSAKNFHLPLDTDKLPHELRPIAERLQEVLEQLQKAFAREKQAAADISHELRTPLAALMTTLEVGLRKPRTPAEYREIIEDSRACGQHMYQLVERLLTLARLDAGADQYRPAEVDVIETALQCADLIRPLAKARGIDVRLHFDEPIHTKTDPDKLREILVNLLHNAVEYNNPNGSIELTIERVHRHVRLEVRDTGVGMAPDVLAHIFERFYRADPSRHADTPHAGLGLAIVKSYVDLMGGTVSVESSSTGTAFVVEFPFIAPHPVLETSIQAAPALAPR